MGYVIIAVVVMVASAMCILFSNRICKWEMYREGMKGLCSLVFCYVGTWLTYRIFDIDYEHGGQAKVIGLTILAISFIFWHLSKYIK